MSATQWIPACAGMTKVINLFPPLTTYTYNLQLKIPRLGEFYLRRLHKIMAMPLAVIFSNTLSGINNLPRSMRSI